MNGFAWGAVARQCAVLISRHGQECVLRRPGLPDRSVRAFIRRITQREMMGGLVDPTYRYALVAAPVSPPPDHQQDSLITFVQPLGSPPVELERLKIMSAPERIEPAGEVAFWKLAVRR